VLVSDKFEQAGLTMRQVNPSDARSRFLTPTDAGLALRTRLLDRLAAATPIAALSLSDQRQLARILGKLAER